MTRKKKGYSIPPTITVGGMKFKIVFKDMEDYGEMDFDKKIISIRNGLSPEDHHAALGVSGLSNILDCENTEEALVRIVDYMVMPVVKQEYKKFLNLNLN